MINDFLIAVIVSHLIYCYVQYTGLLAVLYDAECSILPIIVKDFSPNNKEWMHTHAKLVIYV